MLVQFFFVSAATVFVSSQEFIVCSSLLSCHEFAYLLDDDDYYSDTLSPLLSLRNSLHRWQPHLESPANMAAPHLLSLLYIRFLLAFAFVSSSSSQFLPGSDAKARNLTVVHSPANRDVTVSYKTPEDVCSTAFDSQKQYTGWVSVPGDYPTNLFFWFVEAREPTDSLTIWLNGGPGSSSLYGFFTGNGPCEIVEKGLNEYETLVREWGWDRASNMLFIDQVCFPRQVTQVHKLTCTF